MSSKLLLHPRQYAIAKVLVSSRGVLDVEELASRVSRKVSDLMRDLEELRSKGLIEIIKKVYTEIRLSNLGLRYVKEELPEVKLLNFLRSIGSVGIDKLKELCGLDKQEFSAALGILRRLNVVKVEGGTVTLLKENIRLFEDYVGRLRSLLSDLEKPKVIEGKQVPSNLKELRRRGFIQIKEVKHIYVKATEKLIELFSKGLVEEAQIVTVITEDVIKSGLWERAIFKEFDLSVEVPTLHPKKKHPYVLFLNYVREVLTSMGFIEVKGPHVELELWNFDVLFVPQYHPSRRESDVYFIRDEGLRAEVPHEVLERTKKVHEGIWRYSWDPRKALRLVLRTHTTPISMRTIYNLGGGEYRAFSLDRVFRPETPDPTHLTEFHQLEGIIVGKKVTFKHLLGFFKEFARALGLGEVVFKPAYFPFTEPRLKAI